MAREMRGADRTELSLISGKPDTLEAREAALLNLMDKSRGLAKAGFYDGQLVNVWGVVTQTIIADVGNPWMATTDAATVPSIRRSMAIRCRDEFLSTIPPYVVSLWNVVHAENAAAIRWLKWLNFDFEDQPIHHGGAAWFKFSMRAT